LSGGIAAIPMALYHYQAELGLVPQEVWFVGYILAHRWTSALPYPSLRRMSRRTGVSTQMLHRYKQSLIEKGYLATIARHRPSGGRTSNFYDFSNLFIALEQMLRRDRRAQSWQPTADETDTLDDEPQAGDDPLDADELEDQLELDGDGDRELGRSRRPSALPAVQTRALGHRISVPQSQQISDAAAPAPRELALYPDQRALIGVEQPDAMGPNHAPLTALDVPALPGAEPPARPGNQSRKRKTNASKERQDEQRRSDPRPTTPAVPLTERAVLIASTCETTLETIKGNEGNARPNPALDDTPFAATAAPPRPLVTAGDGSAAGAGPTPSAPNAGRRWIDAKQLLTQRLSAAAFRAWVEPLEALELLAAPPAPGTSGDPTPPPHGDGHSPLRLRCTSAFQCEQVTRRYKAAIEEALGAPVELVVGP
jgi:hypothetical protein